MAVFDSTDRGENRPDSDVDIKVELDTTKDYSFLHRAQDLELMLGRIMDLIKKDV